MHGKGGIVTKLIINADDFGYSKGVNYGIITSHACGVVTSTTMMMNMPEVDHAFLLAKQHSTLGVGIHLVLTCGKPLGDDVPSLVNESGYFHSLPDVFHHINTEDVEKEFTRQVEAFLSYGKKPTHIDSHHHVHAHEKILPIVLKLAERYHLPLRLLRTPDETNRLPAGIKSTAAFDQSFYGDKLSLESLEQILDKHAGAESLEIMTHPAFIDQSLYQGSSYALQRMNELAILTDPHVTKRLNCRDIQLITFAQLG
ncbi:chitin disaccharide deacetylase [Brevibacillus halotolerans]|uniref:chitin disaccharide deacetylase n=1 Tax=Brevibacillus TaxID=55080 RepID=UPI00215CB9B1|nr:MULTISPECIES: chitin disaccharide deacetylase [Brevibacillus]MCR8962532.1 chitin disaccharide deacetylase [Brevibacillus laterosporus]MCZ0834687.1 chitin disaccharide deacetylase [Brevibacillus halotolerans]